MSQPIFSFYKNLNGQSATEYIIILALILSLAIIVFATLGIFPSFSYSAQIGDSVRYWASTASPIALIDFTQSDQKFSAILENRASVNIIVDNFMVSVNNNHYTSTSTPTLSPGEKFMINVTGTPSCSGKKVNRYEVQINYSTDEVSNLFQKGLKPIFVQCSD